MYNYFEGLDPSWKDQIKPETVEYIIVRLTVELLSILFELMPQ